jgi:hypothetical protein
MASSGPVSATILYPVQPIVVDARLLLRPWGLAIATALSLSHEVWLSREFVSLISYNGDEGLPPPLLSPYDEERGAHDLFREGLQIWQSAYANGVVHGSFKWIGDNPAESPGRSVTKPGIVSCFDALIDTLSQNIDLTWAPLVACGLQSIAMAASLAPNVPLILTAASKDGSAPVLCLDARTAEIASQELPSNSSLLDDIVGRTSPLLEIANLMESGIAAVWLAAPRANLINNPDCPGEYAPERYRLTVAECLPWQGSQLFWINLHGGPAHA